MREKYESLALVQLRELAKVRGLKGTSAMKKAELVEAMLAEDERVRQKEEGSAQAGENQPAAEPASGPKPPQRKNTAVNTEAGTPRQHEKGEEGAGTQRQQAGGSRQRKRAEDAVSQTQRQQADGSRQREKTGDTASQTGRQAAGASQQRERAEAAAPQAERQQAGASQQRERTERTRSGGVSDGSGTFAQVSRGEGASDIVAQSPRGEGNSANVSAVQGVGAQQAQARPNRANEVYDEKTYPKELDSGEEASGILEVMPDGYGFIRCANYMPGENDVYVAPSQIRRFGLKTGDILRGNKRIKTQQEKFSALLFIRTINGYTVEEAAKRKAFEDMTPIFPDQRIRLETPGCSIAMRVMDLVSPVGKGQRGMIVSPPKAGKTTLLKEVAKSILRTNPRMHMLILLIDERPEEVTDIKEAISGTNVEVIYSTFDELPDHHKRVSEMVIERAKRLVEHKKDVVILLDSITRLARAYNLVVPPSGRTLSGGLDPAALHMPKRFFGAARNMREGGSLTILATALVDTGSKMDDVIYEEFKGTGNMELILDRKLSEKRIFPAIDLAKSGTRREDLLLSAEELEAINIMRKALNGLKSDEATDRILDFFMRTRTNNDFVQMVKRTKII